MANLTKYPSGDWWSREKDLMEVYYIYKTKFKDFDFEYISSFDWFFLKIGNKKYYFNYKAEESTFPSGSKKYRLIDSKYNVVLYHEANPDAEINDFLGRLKEKKVYECLPLRFLRTLLQTFFFRPVGWLITNLGMEGS